MNEISVLIIDDSEIDRYILNRQLSEIGITEIFEQDDGSSALQFLQQHAINSDDLPRSFPPDVIFLDINMPIMGGFDFLNEFASLREKLALDSCVIMMYSSSERREDKDKAATFEFVKDFLTKGEITLVQLQEKVNSLQA